MKKYLIFVLISSIVVVMTGPAMAAGVGSPETQGQGKIATTTEWSYVFNRDLVFEKATRPPGHNSDMPENFRIDGGYDLAGKISYGLFDGVDIYVKLGIANYDFKGDVLVGDTKVVEETLSAGNGFLYGGGVKLAYESKDGWIFGCDAQYLTSDHELDFSATNMISGVVTTAKYYDLWIQEWHADPYIAKKIGAFTPYAGAGYSDMRISQRHPSDPRRWNDLVFNSDCNIGVFTGIDWSFGDSFKVNVEGRFLDETALSVCAAYRF